ncbi:hypothetical protein EDC04DRAFT_1486148 [Pisolithus marmoratus]|nr:hypothetical protein EDC04DRAFT_1486148 [Pisolithus marmoratus]
MGSLAMPTEYQLCIKAGDIGDGPLQYLIAPHSCPTVSYSCLHMKLLGVVSTFIIGALAMAIPSTPFHCENEKVLSTYFIGENQEVEAQVLSCSNLPNLTTRSVAQKRQTNVCGNTCNTNCFTPAGGGPNPYDCQVIADALFYDNQNIGTLFNITVGNPIFMQYATCETFFVNQASYNETYCRNDWASVIEYVAFNCQSQQNAHGGNCVASDQTWFIQIQTS